MRTLLPLALLLLPACDTTDDNRDYVEPDAAPAKTCRTEYGCTADGWCSGDYPNCYASNDRDCAASEQCRELGVCGFDPEAKRCAITPDGCRASKTCAKRGNCSLVVGVRSCTR